MSKIITERSLLYYTEFVVMTNFLNRKIISFLILNVLWHCLYSPIFSEQINKKRCYFGTSTSLPFHVSSVSSFGQTGSFQATRARLNCTHLNTYRCLLEHDSPLQAVCVFEDVASGVNLKLRSLIGILLLNYGASQVVQW